MLAAQKGQKRPSCNSASCWQHRKVRKDQAVTEHMHQRRKDQAVTEHMHQHRKDQAVTEHMHQRRKDQAVTVHHASMQKGQKRKPLTPEENCTYFSEHATSLCKSYSDAFPKLQAEFLSQSLRGECFFCRQLLHLEHIADSKSLSQNVSVRCKSTKFSNIEICLLLSELFRIYCKRMYLRWGLRHIPCIYLMLGENTGTCTFGGVYIPCVYLNVR